MANYAKVALTGRLVREPKKNTYNSSTVISFTVAVYTTKKVDEKYIADYYNVSYWGKPAEAVFPKLDKGVLVQVYGDLYQEEYSSQNGEKRLGMSVRASDVIKLKDPEKTEPKKRVVEMDDEEDPF